jgi:hypothetical protein
VKKKKGRVKIIGKLDQIRKAIWLKVNLWDPWPSAEALHNLVCPGVPVSRIGHPHFVH